MPTQDNLQTAFAGESQANRKYLAFAAKADAEIIVELLDIILARFQRSVSTARSYHLALIALAGRLTPAPAALS